MKKLLSIVLISAMVLALVPSAFATTTEPDMSNLVRAYNFDFGAAGYAGIDGQTGEAEIGYDTLRDYGDTKTVAEDGTVTYTAEPTTWARTNTDPWVVDGNHRVQSMSMTATGTSENKKDNAFYWYMYGTRAFDDGEDTSSGVVAIRLEINKAGTYFPELSFWARNDLCIYDVYLVPVEKMTAGRRAKVTIHPAGSTNNATFFNQFVGNLPETYKLGTIDMYAENASEVTVSTTGENALASIVVTEDDAKTAEFFLVFRTKGINKTLKDKYGTGDASALYVNLFSFELYQEETEYEFTPSTDDSYTEAPETATVSRLALYGDASETIETEPVTYGNSVTIPAVDKTYTDEETGKTYNFLYWAKGLEEGVSKQILSTSYESFPYKPHAGVNYLIAVYEEAGNAKEAFYNKNGQLLTDLGIKDNKLPALPAMAGRGDAIKWVQRGTDAEFDGGADVSNLEGDKVFMAKYNEPTEGSITINGENYFYGDTISCKDIVDSTENFSYFTRQIGNGEAEIISIDPDYSFSAYADCTIAAVCNGAVTLTTPRKIALSTFSVGENLTAVMAEFIGFEGAKEKGIMFGNKKIAMTTDKAQFTVTNDTEDDVVVTGYAIVGDDKYVDGEITVDAAK